MSVEVTNTLQFHFPNGSAKPTIGDIANFVKALDANPVEMEATYRTADEKAVFIKFKTEASMHYCLTHNPEQLMFNYADGDVVQVCMTLAGSNVQYVRVYGLQPEVPDRNVAMLLGKYGKVKRVVREKFPSELGLNMHTGVRGVYMDVEKEIPSTLHFLNRKGNIYYDGIRNKCFLCKMEGHQMNSCPKRKVRKQSGKPKQIDEQKTLDKAEQEEKEEQSGSSTYAGVVAEGPSLDNKDKEAEEELEVLEEDIEEMEVTTPTVEENNGNQVNEHETQKQSSSRYTYINDEIYKKSLELWKIQKSKEEEKQKKGRMELRAREKGAMKKKNSK